LNQCNKRHSDMNILKLDCRNVDPKSHVEYRDREIETWLKDLPKPLGLLVPGASSAQRKMSLFMSFGYRVPEDIAILSGIDHPDICACSIPTISAIEKDIEERIRLGCEILDKMMNGELTVEDYKVLPKGVTERESTCIYATEDIEVSKALKYIWDNISRNFGITEITQVVGISRRHLENKFKRVVGRSIKDEIIRRRGEEVLRLLRDSKMSIKEISEATGFSSQQHLLRFFRSNQGVTPSDYRASLALENKRKMTSPPR
jgi:LacI family transcriptional regulator